MISIRSTALCLFAGLLLNACGSSDSGSSDAAAGTSSAGGSSTGTGGGTGGTGTGGTGTGGTGTGGMGTGGTGTGGTGTGGTGTGGTGTGGSGTGGGMADIGFRAATDGFAFENYTNDTIMNNLTADDVQRLFGAQVCSTKAPAKCVLTPPAQQWMDETNKGMNGGHCEGMAVTALVFYTKKENAADFGAASTKALTLPSNTKLQSEIAYYFSMQGFSPTLDAEFGKDGGPTAVLKKVLDGLQKGTDSYTIGIYKPGYKEGHAITAYGVTDKGNGVSWVNVYDNNYPGDERHVEIDTTKDTWTYEASTNPSVPGSVYAGDASTKTFTATPLSARFAAQTCPFCSSTMMGPQLNPPYNQVFLTSAGAADLLITDTNGKHLGYVGGNLVNEIPGAKFTPTKSKDLWQDEMEPTYFIPSNIGFSVNIDGTNLKAMTETDITMIGPGYDLAVSGINLDPGQIDNISFSPDGQSITYKTTSMESPVIELGVETTGADYGFAIAAVGAQAGVQVDVSLDQAKGKLKFSFKGASGFGIQVDRVDDMADVQFTHTGNQLMDGDTAYLDYGAWMGQGMPMNLEIDKGSDGTIDQTIPLTDSQ